MKDLIELVHCWSLVILWNLSLSHVYFFSQFVCCLIWLSEGVSSVFVLFPHYFVTLPGKVCLALPVKHPVQMSHPPPSLQLIELRLWVFCAITDNMNQHLVSIYLKRLYVY
uniref:Uncharacterized protein n=1 Tax=Myripristis murdjan TaxID=586833 RepID=A0A667YEG5_9TELE